MTRSELEHAIRAACDVAHDLAASKLVAFRDNDREFVRVLLLERLVDAETLRERLAKLPVAEEERDRLARWAEATWREIER